uniref:Uncharacterized protein n=1 Tax=Avena sativa TaxID=4498 RepID=A0ACD6AFP7_AVESA
MACDDGDWQESPDQAVLFAAEIAAVRAVLGARLPVADVLAALASCGGNADRAINALLDGDADPSDDGDAERAIDALLDAEKARVKAERDVVASTPTPTPTPTPPVKVKAEAVHDLQKECSDGSPHAKRAPLLPPPRRAKDDEEDEVSSRLCRRAGDCGISLVPRAARADVDNDEMQFIDAPAAPPMSKKRAREEGVVDITATHPLPYLNPRPIRAIPPQEAARMHDQPPAPAPRRARTTALPPSSEWKMVVAPPEAEFGEFPLETDWFLVEKSYVAGLSTHSGRRAVDAGEIVHFAFPSYGRLHGGVKVSAKKAAALAQIVRFSTKRAGEIGKLSTEWTKCLVPLVNSSKVKIQGKIVRAPAVYINVFSGEATTKFPSLSRTTRGGILADAMGLGKTVMTIALILSDPRGEHSNYIERDTMPVRGRDIRTRTSTPSIRGGTLIVCPMALLGQWKDELEAHSAPEALSVCVYYGGNRNSDLRLMAEHSVVLTTYGVLQAAHKADGSSVFHMIDWYRIVLDEAHTIKSPKTKAAQAAYLLSSQCRWCLTGTPLQNNLEDLYSLLCFLHVEPWCNANWWQKLIQRPYENGDERGLKLVKAILRPLMLRRTKETKDKTGNPILVLPPAHIEVVECEQTVEERDFYEALFRSSKVQFDKFVAQGNVLSNYANILELLLRLRQCCDHPFLVISKADTKKYTDLDELAQRFLEGVQGDPGQHAIVPSRAYIEEVVEEIRQGTTAECPICLESTSDDPVLTPCAHRMCRECLLSSWMTPAGGPCPLCRSPITKADLINLPGQCRYEVDAKNNWKDSCKVSKLMVTLEDLGKKREKSIVFSQFTSFFDLLEIPLEQKGIEFLRFDGKLSQKHREKVLREFSESQDKLVVLMSLKAGGVGLNLTAASNVFLMDPWWNPAVEEQAIMRIHRIGQKRAVQVRRFIVKDTVEERMQQVQARKQRMISGALTDEEVRSSRIEQLKMLFK